MNHINQTKCPACKTPWDKSKIRSEAEVCADIRLIGINKMTQGYFSCPCGMQVSDYKNGIIKIIRKYFDTYVAVWTCKGTSWLYEYMSNGHADKIYITLPFDLTEEQIRIYLTFS